MIARASSCWLYAPPALSLDVGKYAVMILILVSFTPCSNIHDQRPRLMNSWPVSITLHYTLSTAMVAGPPLLNGQPEMVTLLCPVLILLVLNHPYILLYIFSLMQLLLQLLFTSAIPIFDIPLLIIVFLKVSILC